MRYFLVFMFFINSFLYSQTKESKDSIAYYTYVVNVNIEENRYKNALLYSQKVMNSCYTKCQTEKQAIQTCNLGIIYCDLNKYRNTRASFTKSISLFERRPTSAE